METSRRGFIGSLISFAVTAPAIVRASSLMPVKAFDASLTDHEYMMRELVAITRRALIPGIYIQIYKEHPLLRALEAERVYA